MKSVCRPAAFFSHCGRCPLVPKYASFTIATGIPGPVVVVFLMLLNASYSITVLRAHELLGSTSVFVRRHFAASHVSSLTRVSEPPSVSVWLRVDSVRVGCARHH